MAHAIRRRLAGTGLGSTFAPPPVQGVSFPSGETLPLAVGPEVGSEEYQDPSNSGNPLLDTSGAQRRKKLSKDFSVDELATSSGTRFPRRASTQHL